MNWKFGKVRRRMWLHIQGYYTGNMKTQMSTLSEIWTILNGSKKNFAAFGPYRIRILKKN